jgi:hypothetical protein
MADVTNSFSNGYYSANFFYFGGNTNINYANQAAFALGTGEFTIEFWMNSRGTTASDGFPANTTAGAAIIDFRPSATNGVYPTIIMQAAGTSSNTRLFWFTNTANSITSNSTIASNRWYHVAVTRDSVGNTRMFIDGLVSNSINQSGNNFLVGTSRPIIGVSGNTANSSAFSGYLTNLRIIKGAAAYTANFTVPSSPLTSNSLTSLLIFQNAAYKDNSTANLAVAANGSGNGIISYEEFTPFQTIEGEQRLTVFTGKQASANVFTAFDYEIIPVKNYFLDNSNLQIDTITLPFETTFTYLQSSNTVIVNTIEDSRLEIDAFGKTQTGSGGGQALVPGLIQYWNS